MNYRYTQKYRNILKGQGRAKDARLKKLHPVYSTYMTFWKRQSHMAESNLLAFARGRREMRSTAEGHENFWGCWNCSRS